MFINVSKSWEYVSTSIEKTTDRKIITNRFDEEDFGRYKLN